MRNGHQKLLLQTTRSLEGIGHLVHGRRQHLQFVVSATRCDTNGQVARRNSGRRIGG